MCRQGLPLQVAGFGPPRSHRFSMRSAALRLSLSKSASLSLQGHGARRASDPPAFAYLALSHRQVGPTSRSLYRRLALFSDLPLEAANLVR